jgi:hypothetical protein
MGVYQGRPRGGYDTPSPAQMRHRSDWHRETARINKINEILDRMPKKPTVAEIMEANKDVKAPSSFGKDVLTSVAAAVVVSLVSKAFDWFWGKYVEKPKPIMPTAEELGFTPEFLAHMRQRIHAPRLSLPLNLNIPTHPPTDEERLGF